MSVHPDGLAPSDRIPVALGSIVTLAVAIVLSDFGFVNWDFDYFVAARDLMGGALGPGVRQFVGSQNTPLTQAMLAALFGKLLPLDETFWVVKLPNTIGLALTFACVVTIARQGLGRQRPRSVALLIGGSVVMSPIFVVYGTQASANVLQIGLVMLCLALLHDGATAELSSRRLVVVSGIFGFAIAVKYNVVLLAPMVALVVLKRVRTSRVRLGCRSVTLAGLVASAPAGLVLLWTRWQLGLWGSGNTQQYGVSSYGVRDLILKMSTYVAFLGVFIAPIALPLFPRIRGIRYWALLIGTAAVFYFWASTFTEGEFNFGGLEVVLNLPILWRLLRTGGFVLVIGVCLLAWQTRTSLPQRVDAVMLGAFCYVVLHSLTRPTQRYAMVLVPIVVAFVIAPLLLALKVGRRTLWLSLAMTALVAVPPYAFARSQGQATDRVARWLVTERLEASTSGGIWIHAGQYRIRAGSAPMTHEVLLLPFRSVVPVDAIHTVEMRVLGRLVRTYAVVPLEAGSGG